MVGKARTKEEETMKYTILTLGNPEREAHRSNIRETMSGIEEVFVECVNGKNESQLSDNVSRHGFQINFSEWRPGEGGVWYSNINAWEYSAKNDTDLLVFEDDAIIQNGFRAALDSINTPELADFITLYIPYRNSTQSKPFTLSAARQEHGNVCILYTAQGSRKILEMLEREGLEWPVDIWLFKKALSNQLRGYGPDLRSKVIVDVDFEVPTNIHDDERVLVPAWKS